MNLSEFQAYQEKEQQLYDLMETAKYLRAESRRRFPARARNNSWEEKNWRENVARAKKNLGPIERELSALKSEVFKLRKIASLGVGEWIYNKPEKSLAGGSRYHPEFGTVKYYYFGGWSMQRVAASAFVEWCFDGKTYRRKWSGNQARESARTYLKNVFGI